MFERFTDRIIKTHEAIAMTTPKKKTAKRQTPQISDAEWIVMRSIWEKGPLTTNQVVQALDDKTHWKPKTIHTLLSRLAQKKALSVEKKGREYLFHPLVSAEDCEHEVARSFLRRFFGGEIAPFLARVVEQEKLSPLEIQELKRILDQKKP